MACAPPYLQSSSEFGLCHTLQPSLLTGGPPFWVVCRAGDRNDCRHARGPDGARRRAGAHPQVLCDEEGARRPAAQ
eukprot:4586644-Prymnesium_polylepis.1